MRPPEPKQKKIKANAINEPPAIADADPDKIVDKEETGKLKQEEFKTCMRMMKPSSKTL